MVVIEVRRGSVLASFAQLSSWSCQLLVSSLRVWKTFGAADFRLHFMQMMYEQPASCARMMTYGWPSLYKFAT